MKPLADRLKEGRARSRRLVEQRLMHESSVSTFQQIWEGEVRQTGRVAIQKQSDIGVIKRLVTAYGKEDLLRLIRFAMANLSLFEGTISWTSFYVRHQGMWQALRESEKKHQRQGELKRQEEEEIERLNKEARETIPAHVLENLPEKFRKSILRGGTNGN